MSPDTRWRKGFADSQGVVYRPGAADRQGQNRGGDHTGHVNQSDRQGDMIEVSHSVRPAGGED